MNNLILRSSNGWSLHLALNQKSAGSIPVSGAVAVLYWFQELGCEPSLCRFNSDRSLAFRFVDSTDFRGQHGSMVKRISYLSSKQMTQVRFLVELLHIEYWKGKPILATVPGWKPAELA